MFAFFSKDAVIASTATVSDVTTLDSTSLRRELHHPDLSCSTELDHVFVRSLDIYQQLQTVLYPCQFVIEDGVSEILGDLFARGFYAMNTCALRAAGRTLSSRPASSIFRRASEVVAVESDAEDVVKLPIDSMTGKKIAVRDFRPQS